MITCITNSGNKTLSLVENDEIVGYVKHNPTIDDVEIVFLTHRRQVLTFNEFAIIQDNWNQFQEMINPS